MSIFRRMQAYLWPIYADDSGDSDSGGSDSGGSDSGDSGSGVSESSASATSSDGSDSDSGDDGRRARRRRGALQDQVVDGGTLTPDDYRDIPAP